MWGLFGYKTGAVGVVDCKYIASELPTGSGGPFSSQTATDRTVAKRTIRHGTFCPAFRCRFLGQFCHSSCRRPGTNFHYSNYPVRMDLSMGPEFITDHEGRRMGAVVGMERRLRVVPQCHYALPKSHLSAANLGTKLQRGNV